MHRLFLAAAIAVAPATAFAQTARDNIDALIEQQAKANGVPASFVHAVVKRESNYNPRAKGGSALGLMQIKHATNLRYGVAYLAGAYRTAQGNIHQAYQYYNRGYYYAAKRQGVPTVVASTMAPVAASASALASFFTGTPTPSDAAGVPGALAYAAAEPPAASVEVPLPPRRPAALAGDAQVQYASLTTDIRSTGAAPQAAMQAAVESVEVPLPPRRPDGLAAASTPAAFTELRLSSPASATTDLSAPAAATAEAASAQAEAIAVPLPPQRPSAKLLALAAMPRPAAGAGLVREAVALPAQ